MKSVSFLLIAVLLGTSCAEKSKSLNYDTQEDSIYSEFSTLVIMSYYWNDAYVMEYILVNVDTIEVTRDHEIPSYQEHVDNREHELIKIKKGYYLLPVEEIPRFKRLNVFKVQIYDERFNFVADGICGPELLTNFRVPDIADQKARFYDSQKLFIKRGRQMLCKKHGLTEDDLDKIVFSKLEISRKDSIAQQLINSH